MIIISTFLDPCETKSEECPIGTRCKIYEPTGEAFCEPSCSIENGGCDSDEVCTLQDVVCVRSPCPPMVQCTDPCSVCTSNQTCRLEPVPCLVPPCPVQARCLEAEEVCGLSPDPGPCKALIPRYFHNSTTRRCEIFNYGGCQGNENNFQTLRECEGKCGVDICSLPQRTGPCRALFRRYYYNARSGQCEMFTYGGCQGNSNNFRTASQCEERCVDKCTLPSEVGPCDGDFPRFFHNPATRQCERFSFGGCSGNRNNFETLAECQDECGGENNCELAMRKGPCS